MSCRHACLVEQGPHAPGVVGGSALGRDLWAAVDVRAGRCPGLHAPMVGSSVEPSWRLKWWLGPPRTLSALWPSWSSSSRSRRDRSGSRHAIERHEVAARTRIRGCAAARGDDVVDATIHGTRPAAASSFRLSCWGCRPAPGSLDLRRSWSETCARLPEVARRVHLLVRRYGRNDAAGTMHDRNHLANRAGGDRRWYLGLDNGRSLTIDQHDVKRSASRMIAGVVAV